MGKKKSFVIRIQQELYDGLERWSTDEFRSVNGQIEYILFQSMKSAGRIRDKSPKPESGKESI